MEVYLQSCLTPTLHGHCFLPSRTSHFTRGKVAIGSSKNETNSAHIGEGLSLSVFDLWIAAYESSVLFRNVRPRHHFTSQKKESSATLRLGTSSPDR
jgi:hypothetical protein